MNQVDLPIQQLDIHFVPTAKIDRVDRVDPIRSPTMNRRKQEEHVRRFSLTHHNLIIVMMDPNVSELYISPV